MMHAENKYVVNNNVKHSPCNNKDLIEKIPFVTLSIKYLRWHDRRFSPAWPDHNSRQWLHFSLYGLARVCLLFIERSTLPRRDAFREAQRNDYVRLPLRVYFCSSV